VRERRLGRREGIVCAACLALLAGLLFVAGSVNPEIRFPDPNLESAVRAALGLPDGAIYYADARRKASLDVSNSGIVNPEGLQFFEGLNDLNLEGNEIEDLAPLSVLRRLSALNLRQNRVRDLAPLARMTGLRSLNLRGNAGIVSLEPLARLANLEELVLRDVPVGENAATLRGMKRLTRLDVRNCGIEDFAPIADLLEAGALRDAPGGNVKARADLRDNPALWRAPEDVIARMRPHWDHIAYRYPSSLRTVPVRSVRPPVFSPDGGFYADGFMVSLAADTPETAIYYTLDGSEPTARSIRYTGPLAVAGPEPDPEGALPRATVIRAVGVSPEGIESNIATRTFFVHPLASDRYALPVVSIAMEPGYLFDPSTGIYTDENCEKRGMKWERPAHIELFEQDGAQALSQNIGVRIQGGKTRLMPQKSLRLYARECYDDAGVFRFEAFPGLTKADGEPLRTFHALVLRAGGDTVGNQNNGTMMRDAFLQSLVRNVDSFEKQAQRPAVVFLNGAYWGIYNICEYIDAYYLASHHGVREEEVAILEENAFVKAGDARDADEYLALRDYVDTCDMAEDSAYQTVTSELDVRSLADYYAANVYFQNRDWPQNNIRFWRRSVAGGGRASPWRWILYDADYSFHLWYDLDSPDAYANKYDADIGARENSLSRLMSEVNDWNGERWPNVLWRRLVQNGEFRNLFINSVARQLNSVFAPHWVVRQWEAYRAQYAPEMREHYRRWLPGYSASDWDGYAAVLRDFALLRPGYMRRHTVECFGLRGTAEVSVAGDPAEGFVRIEGLPIREDTPGVSFSGEWTGVYFLDVPLRVEAVAEPGYLFSGWEHGGQEPSFVLKPACDMTLRPVFAPVGPMPDGA